MQIILAGCGKVGQALCRELVEENHDVSVIDIEGNRVSDLVNAYDVLGFVGSAVSTDILEEAGVREADLFLAMTHSDEVNLLCCLLAKAMGNCQTMARVRNPEYKAMLPYLKEELNLVRTISPESAGAREIARVLRFPGVLSVDSFANGNAEIISFRVDEHSILANMYVRDVPDKTSSNILICTVNRMGKVHIPNGEFQLRAGDRVSIAGSGLQTSKFFKKIGLIPKPVKRLMIVGGSLLAYYLCRELEKDPIEITVIDSSAKVCSFLSENLPGVTVVHGEGCDENLLLEEGIDRMDAFAGLTGIDEENIVLTLYAKRHSSLKTIAKVDKIRFDEVLNSLDLDTVINLKEISAEEVLRYVRSLNTDDESSIVSVYRMGEGTEAIEWRITKTSQLTGIPLARLNVRKGVIIAGIIRKGRFILPRGNDVLKVGDQVIVVTDQVGLQFVSQILEGGKHA